MTFKKHIWKFKDPLVGDESISQCLADLEAIHGIDKKVSEKEGDVIREAFFVD